MIAGHPEEERRDTGFGGGSVSGGNPPACGNAFLLKDSFQES